jgi:hypothetical protein
VLKWIIMSRFYTQFIFLTLSFLAVFTAKAQSYDSLAYCYSTYFGRDETASLFPFKQIIAPDGSIWLAGRSRNIPVTPNAPQPSLNGPTTTSNMLAKFSGDGQLLFSTYMGGQSTSSVVFNDMVVASDGSIFYAQAIQVSNPDFLNDLPTTSGVFQPSPPVGPFIALHISKYNAQGQLIFATFYGGTTGFARDAMLAEGPEGSVYISGLASNTIGGIPLLNAYQTSPSTSLSRYVARISSTGQLMFSTYFNGTGQEFVNNAMAMAPDGSLYIFGRTNSSNLPIINPPAPFATATQGAVLMRFSPSGQPLMSTRLGSTSPNALHIDAAGNVYLLGTASSGPFPVVNAPHSLTLGAGIYKLTPDNTVVYSFRWGVAATDFPSDLAVAPDGSVAIVGSTRTTTFPVLKAAQPVIKQESPTTISNFVASFGPTGAPVFSTFWGGSRSEDQAPKIKVIANGDIYVTNHTGSADLITTNAALIPAPSYPIPSPIGRTYAYLSRFNKSGSLKYSTYWGRWAMLQSFIAVKDDGTIYFTGTTGGGIGSSDPLTYQASADALQPTPPAGGFQNGRVFTIFRPLAIFDIDSIINVVSPDTQRFCLGGPIQPFEGTRIEPAGRFLPRYQWQVSLVDPADPVFDSLTDWINLPGAILQDLTPPTAPENRWYRRLVTTNAPTACDDPNPNNPPIVLSVSNIVHVVGSPFQAPIVDAGGDLLTCLSVPTQIGGAPTVTGGLAPYNINWDFGSFLSDSTAANPIATVTQNTIFTIQVTDANNCYNLSQMTLKIDKLGAPDTTFCVGFPVRIGTAPVAGEDATYSWTPAAGLSCTDCPRPIATPALTTTYYLTKTLNLPGGDTCSIYDTIVVNYAVAPTAVVDDVVVCYSVPNIFEIGYPAESDFAYTWAPGLYLVRNDSSAVNFNSGSIFLTPDGRGGNPINPNPFPYTLSAFKGNCAWYDTMTVTMIRADADIDGCGPRTIGRDWHPQIPATYAWSVVSGPDNIVGPRNEVITTVLGSDTATSIYELEVCFQGVCCTDQVIVPPCGGGCGISVQAPFGCNTNGDPQFNPVVLTGTGSFTGIPNYDSTKVSYSWSPCEGLSDCNSRVVTVLDTVGRTYTLTVGYEGLPPSEFVTCSVTLSPPSVSLPKFNADTTYLCFIGDAVLIGQPAVSGYEYSWEGPNNFLSTEANPLVSPNSTPAVYTVTVTDIGTGCFIRDTAVVLGGVLADAGPDKVICPGAVVQIGTPDPSGGVYEYFWQPANAPWQDSTDSTSAQPKVLVATDLTFYLTVTDPVSGCVARDTMEIVSDTNGPGVTIQDVTICSGESAMIGPEPEFNWVYLWSPAGGLSCTDCAQPIANPTATTVYSVSIIPSGACVVYNETLTVTVNSTDSITLDPIETCPALNVPLNPTSLGECAGCTYSWTNPTALNDASVINPSRLASQSATTNFTLTVTDSDGCNRYGVVDIINEPDVQLPPLDTLKKCPLANVSVNPAEVGACIGCTYSWVPANVLSNPTTINPTTNSLLTSLTILELTVTQPDGCITKLIRVVDLLPDSVLTIPAVDKCPVSPAGNAPLNPGLIGQCVGCTYAWSGFSISPNNTINPNSTAGFAQTHTLTVTQPNGCRSVGTVNVNIIPNDTLAPLSPVVRCPTGGGVSLNPSSLGQCVGCTYAWSPTNNLSSTTVINPTSTTTVDRRYTLVVTQANGCRNVRTVDVSLAPSPDAGEDKAICLGETVVLGSANNSPASTYSWSPAAGLNNANVRQPVFTPTAAGLFTFTMTETRLVNAANCVLTDEVNINVVSVPEPLMQNAFNICEGTCIELGPEADPNNFYIWFPIGELDCIECANPTVCPSFSEVYNLIVIDGSSGCSSFGSVSVNLIQEPIPIISMPDPFDVCQGSNQVLSLNVGIDPIGGNYEFNWSPTLGLSNPFVLQPSLSTSALPVGLSKYVLNVTDLNTGCGNITDTVEVNIAPTPAVICPTSFSTFLQQGVVELQSGTPLGGVYSGPGVVFENGNYFFDPFVSGFGLHSLQYTYTSPDACDGSCLLQVLVLDQAVLPVEWLLFEATLKNEKVFLDWVTASELNNDRFEIERSADAVNWEYLGSVSGSGTSSLQNTYQFIDAYPVVGVNYYRLKQVDFDGKFEYSLIRSVNVETVGSNQLVRWYPNPSKGEVIIVPVSDIKWVIVTDMAGRSVLVKELSAGAEQTLSLGEIPAGTYLISFVTDKIEQTDKLIIQR